MSLSEHVGTELLFENEYVRVWNLEVGPGEATTWHEHRFPYFYIVTEPGSVETQNEDGSIEKQLDHLNKVVMRGKDQVHRLVNVGTHQYRNLIVELKIDIDETPPRG